jgi:predicted CXXCH cytochrome family protein
MNKSIVALALAVFASTASAAITNSRHDFINNGYVTTTPASTCVFCHVPHGGQTGTAGLPLWAPGRSLITPTAYYTGLTTTAGLALTITSVDAKGSRTCLGCHASGSTTDMGTSIPLPPNLTSGRDLILGTDISNDHPIGDQLTITQGQKGMQASIVLGGLTIANGVTTMQCSTCHDVHNTTGTTQPGSKLLRSYTGDFCIACHNK